MRPLEIEDRGAGFAPHIWARVAELDEEYNAIERARRAMVEPIEHRLIVVYTLTGENDETRR